MPRSAPFSTVVLTLLVCGAIALAPASASAAQGPDFARLGEQTVQLLREYLRVDTVNPPGDGLEAARFLARIFQREGIDYEIFESGAGRSNLVAGVPGDGTGGGAVLLLNHTDVVPADARYWSQPPFEGRLVNGQIVGRGAADMKGYGLAQAMTLVALRRSGIVLGRDVLFLATADEESGGMEGAGWVVENRPELLADVEYVLTEGGGLRRVGARTAHLIEVTQKTPLWLRLTASGVSGHGSQAIRESAVNRLVRALDRIRNYRPQIRLVEPVADMLRATAAIDPDPARARALREPGDNIGDPAFLDMLSDRFGNLLRSTIAITVMEGGPATNVIAPRAVAELDCRLLPGEDTQLFVATLRDVIDDPSISIDTLLSFESSSSPTGTPLWQAIEAAARRRDPGAVMVPTVIAGFTDAHWFRERGMVAYGWAPILFTPADGPAHGVDESVSAESIRQAPEMLFDVLVSLAAPETPS